MNIPITNEELESIKPGTASYLELESGQEFVIFRFEDVHAMTAVLGMDAVYINMGDKELAVMDRAQYKHLARCAGYGLEEEEII